MMRIVWFGLIACVAAAGAWAAGADPMQGRYGNTVRITNAAGQITRIYYNVDKSVTVMRPDGAVISGSWEIEGAELCVSASVMLMSVRRCSPFVPDKKPGDSWTQKGPDGDEVTIAIVAGRI
jgi:hypothetical protein